MSDFQAALARAKRTLLARDEFRHSPERDLILRLAGDLIALGEQMFGPYEGKFEHDWEVYGPGHECSYVDCYCDHTHCLSCGVEQGTKPAEVGCPGPEEEEI